MTIRLDAGVITKLGFEGELIAIAIQTFKGLPLEQQGRICELLSAMTSQAMTLFAIEQLNDHRDCEEDCGVKESLSEWLRETVLSGLKTFENSLRMNLIIQGIVFKHEYATQFPPELQAEAEKVREQVLKATELASAAIGDPSLASTDEMMDEVIKRLDEVFKNPKHH